MSSWMQELAVLLEAEFHARLVAATLATVDAAGEPRARMVVVRHFDEKDGSIWITTDGRSAKMDELRHMPVGEIVFWATHERQQFRLHGPITVVTAESQRAQFWNAMRDAMRATFYWPAPGSPHDSQVVYATAAPAGAPIPAHFVLLVLRPTEVDSLELSDHPHRRRRWRAKNDWQVELINA